MKLVSKWLLAIFLSLVALAPIAYFVYSYGMNHHQPVVAVAVVEYTSYQNGLMEPGSEFHVRSCQILDGYKFFLLLDNNEWVQAHLAVATKPEATDFVVKTLREASDPVVVLRRNVDNYWIVDFRLTIGTEQTMLRDLLGENDLLL